MAAENEKCEMARPQIRFALKSRIVGMGYRTYSDFANTINVDLACLSRICNGHQFPSGPTQRRMCDALGLTLKELQELL